MTIGRPRARSEVGNLKGPHRAKPGKRAPEGSRRAAATASAQRGGESEGAPPSEVKEGAEDWNRTSDTSIFSAVLYQLSYLGPGRTLIITRRKTRLKHRLVLLRRV
jgi:hypothetical protein